MTRIVLYGFLLMLVACGPRLDEVTIEFNTIQFPTDSPTRSIWMHQDGKQGIVVGGNQFGLGWCATTEDGWETYQYDSLIFSVLLDIDCMDNGSCLITGFGGRYYSGNPAVGWKEHAAPFQKRLSGVEAINDQFIIVGGSGLGEGIIHWVDSDGALLETIDSLRHELDDVILHDDHIVASGYGILMSRPVGAQVNEWDISDVQGDFYKGISVTPGDEVFCVGEFGSILKSKDRGESWEISRNGNLLWVSDIAFQDIEMIDQDHGLVTGKGDVCWLTDDSGEHWSEIKELPKGDYYRSVGRKIGDQHHYWVAGSKGRLIHLQRSF